MYITCIRVYNTETPSISDFLVKPDWITSIVTKTVNQSRLRDQGQKVNLAQSLYEAFWPVWYSLTHLGLGRGASVSLSRLSLSLPCSRRAASSAQSSPAT